MYMRFSLPKLGALILLMLAMSTVVKADQNKAQFDLFEYFDRDVYAWGLFEARFGDLKREFKVLIDGEVSGNELVLREYFIYADGEKQTRIWRITKNADGTYTGTAPDVIGTAKGTVKGNALTWKYKLDLEMESSSLVVHFDDRMYLNDDDTMINRAIVSKWGIKVGEVSLFFAPANLLSKRPELRTEFENYFGKL